MLLNGCSKNWNVDEISYQHESMWTWMWNLKHDYRSDYMHDDGNICICSSPKALRHCNNIGEFLYNALNLKKLEQHTMKHFNGYANS